MILIDSVPSKENYSVLLDGLFVRREKNPVSTEDKNKKLGLKKGK